MARRAVKVRHQSSRAGLQHFGYGLFRFALYGFLGVALEVCFYNLVRTFRGVPVIGWLFMFDWRVDPSLHLGAMWDVPGKSLYGQCSLWMFPVYAVACFSIEFLYRKLPHVHLGLRALAYGLSIFGWECLSGWLLYWATGLKVWFYADAGNFFQMTSWFILPIWCITGVLVEYIYRQLMDPDLVKAIETAHLEPEYQQPAK
ncbi:MAG: hypothetical protein U0228_05625 [Myxococcaceae bacterium]